MKKVLLTHPGTQHSFKLAAELNRKGLLQKFCTGIALTTIGLRGILFKKLVQRYSILKNRQSNLPASKLCMIPFPELKAIFTRSRREKHDVYYERNFTFQQKISARMIRKADIVVGFDGCSWLLADKTHAQKRLFILDQSTTHPLNAETTAAVVRKNHPEWIDDLQVKPDRLIQLEMDEHSKADRIVVASSFTRKTLLDNGVDEKKIVTIPYGIDLEKFSAKRTAATSEKIRFVYVGKIGAYKGIPLLIEAWKKLAIRDAELWLIGGVNAHVRKLIPELPGLVLKGMVPHEALPKLMQECDVFVFPSYGDGFGLVLLEAMACGLPVIATTTSAGPELITQGEEGFIIEPGSVDQIVESMQYFAANRQELKKMAAKARLTAEKYTWEAYGDKWAALAENSPR